jgi:hypothetical protein
MITDVMWNPHPPIPSPAGETTVYIQAIKPSQVNN